MSLASAIPSNDLILCYPLLLPPSIFPSIRDFFSEWVLCIRWPKYWSFSFSISPSSEYSGLISFRMDWLEFAFYLYGFTWTFHINGIIRYVTFCVHRLLFLISWFLCEYFFMPSVSFCEDSFVKGWQCDICQLTEGCVVQQRDITVSALGSLCSYEASCCLDCPSHPMPCQSVD